MGHGFNKKLLDHFSVTLRYNQYPKKRYLGDKARFIIFLAESDIFYLLYQLGDMMLNCREHKKGKYFYLSDNAQGCIYGSLVTSHLMEENNHLNKYSEGYRETHMHFNISS